MLPQHALTGHERIPMTSVNLTKKEAQHRSDMLDVEHYTIHLDLTTGEETFSSITTARFKVKKSGDTFIDLRAKNVTEVLLDGEDITAKALTLNDAGYDEEHGIALTGLTEGEHTLQITADAVYSHSGQGLHRFVDPADNRVYMYTQFEAADAKRMFACFDQPDLKATYDLTVVTPDDFVIVTNAPVETHVRDGKATHTSTIDYRLSTYLVALIAGPYFEVKDSWTGTLTKHPETPEGQYGPHAGQADELTIPLSIYCRQSIAEALDADVLFEQTKQGFDFYHQVFGVMYPFHKYDQVFCPEYNMGAMENAGCVTFRDEYVFTSKPTEYRYERRCDTILHEMAHMWFGDLVTMQWWDDLWLNESFATWSAATAMVANTKYKTAWVTYCSVEKAWAYAQDTLPTTHPISTDASDIEAVEQNFDGITYAKGMSVLKQLAAYVGQDAFLAGVRLHFARHAFGNATFDDLLQSLSESSGRDLSDWAHQWLKTTGVNALRPAFTVEDGKYTSFAVEQDGAQPGNGEFRTHRIGVGLYSLIDGKVTRTDRVEVDIDSASKEVSEFIGKDAADLVLVNDDDLTYAIMELDPASLSFVQEHIGDIEDPMARALCWSAAWQMVRNAKMRGRDFVELVRRGAPVEKETAVLGQILAQATTAVTRYSDPEWVEAEGNALLATTLLEGAKVTRDFGQVAFVNQLLSVTPTEEAKEFFRSILEGTPSIDGVEVDAELKWKALTALIAAGDINDPEEKIRAMREEDKLASGQNSAWRAGAAIPTKDVKTAVWKELTDTSRSMSNLERRHKLEGLTFAGSAPLLEPFAKDYFALAPRMWKNFSSETALQMVEGLFPYYATSQETVDTAQVVLDSEHPAALHRVIAEGQDRLQRALRNREADK